MRYIFGFIGMIVANLIAISLFAYTMEDDRDDENEVGTYPQQEIFTSDELRNQYQIFHEKKVQ